MHRALALVASLLLAALLAPPQASAQAWPTKPVKVIVPYAPGGSTDNATRPFLEKVSIALGQQFVIENKGGASGAIGVEAAAKSPPDGYTFVVSPVASVTVIPNARPTNYDVFRDLAPVTQFADSTYVIAVHPSIPANTLQEFVAYAKANPGKVFFGSSGLGTITQMIVEVFKQTAGIDLVHVPYRGGAESLTDFLAGHVQVITEGIVMPHAKVGKAKILAIVDTERTPEFPDVPTIMEIYPSFDVLNWFGLFAPAGTPKPIIDRLAAEMNKAAQAPDMREQMQKLALKPKVSSPEDLAAKVRKDYDRYAKVVRDLNLKLE